MNAIYDISRMQLMTAQLNWLTLSLILSAWRGPPAFDKTDITLADITAGGATEAGFSLPIAGQAVLSDGTAQSDSVVIPAVPIGAPVTFFTMSKKHATVHASSQPILFIDQAEGLPFTPNGLDMLIEPDWLLERGWWKG